jgi:hypothetical protein
MRDGLADGLARVRERMSTLRGRGEPGESAARDRYVLLPAGAGRRRRLAEIGAAAGAVVVVLAFVGATVALRPTSSSSPEPNTPGLPAPTESVQSSSGSSAPASSPAPAAPTARPTGGLPLPTTRYTPGATATASPTTPAPTTKPAKPAPPRTTPPRTTPPPSATVSPSPSPTPSPTDTTEPPAPGIVDHPNG